MDVIVTADRVFTIDPKPTATAGSVAELAAAEHGVKGTTFTLKAGGDVLAPTDRVAGRSGPFELIEHVPDESAPVEPTVPVFNEGGFVPPAPGE